MFPVFIEAVRLNAKGERGNIFHVNLSFVSTVRDMGDTTFLYVNEGNEEGTYEVDIRLEVFKKVYMGDSELLRARANLEN